MGLLDTPPNAGPWLRRYSLFLKFEANIFLGIYLVAYLCKWGVAWHDAGDVWTINNTIKFSAYWDMILIIYTFFGVYVFQASFDPVAFRPFLSFGMWGANFAHGVVAFGHCFDENEPSSRYQENSLGGNRNLDKMFVAVPLWFVMWGVNCLFTYKCFGNCLLPWDHQSMVVPVPEAYEDTTAATTIEAVENPTAAKGDHVAVAPDGQY